MAWFLKLYPAQTSIMATPVGRPTKRGPVRGNGVWPDYGWNNLFRWCANLQRQPLKFYSPFNRIYLDIKTWTDYCALDISTDCGMPSERTVDIGVHPNKRRSRCGAWEKMEDANVDWWKWLMNIHSEWFGAVTITENKVMMAYFHQNILKLYHVNISRTFNFIIYSDMIYVLLVPSFFRVSNPMINDVKISRRTRRD